MQVTKGFTDTQVAALKRPRSVSDGTVQTPPSPARLKYAAGQTAGELPAHVTPSAAPVSASASLLSFVERLLPLLVPLVVAKLM
jgi:hypothetical protein